MTIISTNAHSQGIKKIRQIKGFTLNQFQMKNSQILCSQPDYYKYSPSIMDIINNKQLKLADLMKIPGIPVPPKVAYGAGFYERARLLKEKGTYWSWYSKNFIYYDAIKQEAGILLVRSDFKKTGKGRPKCPRGENGIYEPFKGKYFCPVTNSYILDEQFKEVKSTWYYHLDTKTKKVAWKINIGETVYPVASSSSQQAILFFSRFQPVTRPDGPKVTFLRLNVKSRKMDWSYSVSVPTRVKKGRMDSSGLSYFVSDDLSRIFMREYDEKDKRHPNGYLSNPKPQGYIIDVQNKKHKNFSVPVTTYGSVFSKDLKSLFISSHQLGLIIRIDTSTGKEISRINTHRNTYTLALSPSGKYLYSFHYRGIRIFEAKTMSKIKDIPLSSISDGAWSLLAVAPITVFNGYFSIPVLDKIKGSKYVISTSSPDFVLFKFTE
ncbi:hypothetical protein KKD49_12480 [Myxococcota bacterium]|nr:hypothetical protein [Myxococcota bacterium]